MPTTNLTHGKLSIIPTPIGNLGDVTVRAVETLKAADVVLTEDTRRSGILFKHYNIEVKKVSFYDSIETRRIEQVLGWLRNGKNVALITDAGMPGISDPGYRLTKAVIDAGLLLEVLPGPSAIEPALLYSGLPLHRFVFEGFLPVKRLRRKRMLELAKESRTIVLFEAPHKLQRTLTDLALFLGSERPAVMCREMTKIYEEVVRSTIGGIAIHCYNKPPKGEIALVIAGKEDE
ncbi:MAG: 16S rRNA (cytidine(1402)-2'-O)-methyltransferase [Calditrichaeota bacterium]|nr:16S rRNA (cytidine(1402)-2'-O)-methyltransferase [Calditrichota bacterium]